MKHNGFTFVELVVVIAIIGMLTGLILPVFLHGGLDEGVSTLQSSILNAKTFAITKRKRCTLTLSANYYTGSNPLPCTITVGYTEGTQTVNKQYRFPKYIRFWQYQAVSIDSTPGTFTSGTRTVYFEPSGISYDSRSGSNNPMDTVITLIDEKTRGKASPVTASRTIIGNTCQIKKE
ncbi:MAG TPA: pilus assembly FimT family protein [Candidatus Wunengus sp. YC60]|uniref:pilus assembly FimT family protein n=1 Tax=Candidatus Wunengus sp. YC60 TaxID=3367697 RepID=UPI004028989E